MYAPHSNGNGSDGASNGGSGGTGHHVRFDRVIRTGETWTTGQPFFSPTTPPNNYIFRLVVSADPILAFLRDQGEPITLIPGNQRIPTSLASLIRDVISGEGEFTEYLRFGPPQSDILLCYLRCLRGIVRRHKLSRSIEVPLRPNELIRNRFSANFKFR